MRNVLIAIAAMSLAFSACRGRDGDLPEPYRHLVVPETLLQSDQARDRGRRLYLEHCALCHGDQADGRGIRRSALNKAPQDFTSRAWMRRMTPRRVFSIIREGSPGTAMPAWKIFDDEETWDLTAYLLSVAGKP
jgi:mono/diheme cytochrome c family protein